MSWKLCHLKLFIRIWSHTPFEMLEPETEEQLFTRNEMSCILNSYIKPNYELFRYWEDSVWRHLIRMTNHIWYFPYGLLFTMFRRKFGPHLNLLQTILVFPWHQTYHNTIGLKWNVALKLFVYLLLLFYNHVNQRPRETRLDSTQEREFCIRKEMKTRGNTSCLFYAKIPFHFS
jgi:hypothetical protein